MEISTRIFINQFTEDFAERVSVLSGADLEEAVNADPELLSWVSDNFGAESEVQQSLKIVKDFGQPAFELILPNQKMVNLFYNMGSGQFRSFTEKLLLCRKFNVEQTQYISSQNKLMQQYMGQNVFGILLNRSKFVPLQEWNLVVPHQLKYNYYQTRFLEACLYQTLGPQNIDVVQTVSVVPGEVRFQIAQ